jgi:hypothetical protein
VWGMVAAVGEAKVLLEGGWVDPLGDEIEVEILPIMP